MKPSSPGHSLQYINAHMQTEEILKEMHMWMIPRRKEVESKRICESPLETLIAAIRRVLELVKNGKIVPLYPNPFNEEFKIRLRVDIGMEEATEHDVMLLKQQLQELDKTYQKLEKTGYWKHQREIHNIERQN